MKEFTVHICNPRTTTQEMYNYLNKRFGPERDNKDNRVWYLGRDYSKGASESHLSVIFQGGQSAKHSLMMFEHPYTVTKEVSDADALAADNTFKDFFE